MKKKPYLCVEINNKPKTYKNMKRKLYQIELTDANGVLHIPYMLFSWQVFKSKEHAEKWAKEHLYDSEKEMDMVIKEYNEDDIEDYSFVDF